MKNKNVLQQHIIVLLTIGGDLAWLLVKKIKLQTRNFT
jgi:hypothetical protein